MTNTYNNLYSFKWNFSNSIRHISDLWSARHKSYNNTTVWIFESYFNHQRSCLLIFLYNRLIINLN